MIEFVYYMIMKKYNKISNVKQMDKIYILLNGKTQEIAL